MFGWTQTQTQHSTLIIRNTLQRFMQSDLCTVTILNGNVEGVANKTWKIRQAAAAESDFSRT